MDWFYLVTNDGYALHLMKSKRSDLTNEEVNRAMKKYFHLEDINCLPFYIKASYAGTIPDLDEILKQ